MKKIDVPYWLLLLCLGLFACSRHDHSPEYSILKGDFDAALVETGELLAVNARSVLVPYIGWQYGWQFRITGMVDHGTHVKEGDSIAQLDPATVLKFLVEQENLLETEKANLNKLLVENEVKIKALEVRLEEVQADHTLKKLELDKFEYESPRKKEIKQLEFQQAEIDLERIMRTIELEKKICKNSLKIQKIKVSQIESNVNDAHSASKKLKILSPLDGIFQISISRISDQLYRVGDNTYQGAELALVPDLSRIKIRSTINETDIGKVKTGQRVIVRLEAYPDKPFTGKVSDIGKLSYKKEEKSTVKIFDFAIILDNSDPVLKPGMTVSCEVFYSELKDVLYVDNSCLKKVDDTYYLNMKVNKSWVEQPVEIGPRNNNYTVVYGDFKEGTKLMLPEKNVIAQNQ
jgi:multidrug efflux pump subunit AcrA (membrane-fusion protein)